MKKHIIYICLSTFLFTEIQAQQSPDPKTEKTLHDGLQGSFYLGGAAGPVKCSLKDLGTAKFNGPSFHCSGHVGFAKNSWAGGFHFGVNSMFIQSANFAGTTLDPDAFLSFDNSIFGLYVTRYFMPRNFYITGEAGVGRLSLSDIDGGIIGQTQPGMAWSVRLGKEFILRKTKRLGLGFYINLSGIRCRDQAPNSQDIYSYIGPGAGLSFSFN